MVTSGKRGSGRPPAGDTSVRDALLRAGATAPALYHHFGNKTGPYLAAARAAQEHVLETFRAATVNQPAGADGVSALLAAAVALRREHPNVARYLSVIRQDVERHPELGQLAAYDAKFDAFWRSAANAQSEPGRAVAVRAMIEGLLAVGGAQLGLDDVAAGAQVLGAVLAKGLGHQ
jgi:AcrR family transcriptional regulator